MKTLKAARLLPSSMVATEDMESDLEKYYGEEQVLAIVALKVDTKEADRIAARVSEFAQMQDVFLVTGDTDIIAKARFANYKELKAFVLQSLMPIRGVKDAKTLMVVTAYKENGAVREPG